jgi:hypothetical protein
MPDRRPALGVFSGREQVSGPAGRRDWREAAGPWAVCDRRPCQRGVPRGHFGGRSLSGELRERVPGSAWPAALLTGE